MREGRKDRRYRILHVVDNMGKGGLENGVANLIERLDPDTFEHVVCVMRHLGFNSDRLPRDRARVVQIRKPEGGSRFQLASMLRVIRSSAPDIVHTRNWATIEGVLAARLAGVRGLVHGEHGLDTGEDTHEPWRRKAFRRVAYELADRVLCVSHQLRNVHSARTGFSANRITVVHNGADMKRFAFSSSVRESARRELGIAETDFCIGCVGNLTPVKDYATLFRAIGIVANQRRNWRLLIFGDGPERAKYEQMVNERPEWAGRVSFQGLSNRIPEFLNALDVYVLTSLTEGISNSLLEAMATSLPVVITDTGGNPEVVVDNESGLLFPIRDAARLADHLQMLEANPDMRLRLGQQAVRRIRQSFSIDSMVQSYSDIYCSLLPQARVVSGRTVGKSVGTAT